MERTSIALVLDAVLEHARPRGSSAGEPASVRATLESVAHLLRRHVPTVAGSSCRAMVWLDWGVLGHGDGAVSV